MAENVTGGNLFDFGLKDSTLNRIADAGAAGTPKEGDKTIFDTIDKGLGQVEKGVDAYQKAIDEKKKAEEEKKKADDQALADLDEVLIANMVNKQDWTNITTLDQLITIQKGSREEYIQAVEDGDVELQAKLLEKNKGQSASLQGWKDSLDIARGNFYGPDGNMDFPGLYSEAYLTQHPRAARIIKAVATQKNEDGTPCEIGFDEDSQEMYFLVDNEKIYERDFDKINSQGLKNINGKEFVRTPKNGWPTNWSYDETVSDIQESLNKTNIVSVWSDAHVFGTEPVRQAIKDGFLSAADTKAKLPIPASLGADMKNKRDLDGDGTPDTYADFDVDGDGYLDRGERKAMSNELDEETVNIFMDALEEWEQVQVTDRNGVEPGGAGYIETLGPGDTYKYADQLIELTSMYAADLQMQNGAGAPPPPSGGGNKPYHADFSSNDFNIQDADGNSWVGSGSLDYNPTNGKIVVNTGNQDISHGELSKWEKTQSGDWKYDGDTRVFMNADGKWQFTNSYYQNGAKAPMLANAQFLINFLEQNANDQL